MKNEELSEDTRELYETFNEFIETLKESADNESQISGILTLLKSIIELLQADRSVSSHQSKVLYSLNESSQVNAEAFIELYERIAMLEKNVSDLASNSSVLAQQVVKLAETTNEIPVINIDNLLKTLNKHTEEINGNTASIKAIKNKLNL